MRPTGLPAFDQPPVVEVAVSVQFESPLLDTPHVMLFWSQVRSRFPVIEQTPSLPPTIETFEAPKVLIPNIEFKLLDAPPTPRVFLHNKARTELIQLQQDRFGYNWRRLQPDDNYPHYEAIKESFAKEFAVFEEFLSNENLGEMRPTQCEVTYVNHVFGEGIWQKHGELYKVIPSVTPKLTDDFLPSSEEVRYSSKYVLADEENKPLGRLYVRVEPRYLTTDMTPIFLMQLTARGAPQGTSLQGLLKTLDLGHEWIVRGFTALTAPEMHKAWRRKQ